MMKATGHLLCAILLCLSNIGATHAKEAGPQDTVDSQTGTSGSIPAETIPSRTKPLSVVSQSPNKTGNQTTNTAPSKSSRPIGVEFKSGSTPDIGSGLIQVTFGLFVVLMIIAGAAWFTRRFGQFQATAGGALRIVGGLHLGAKERLVVVQVGEEQLLLGVAPGRVSKLHLLAKPLNVANEGFSKGGRSAAQAPGNFREYLSAVLKRDSK